MRKLSTLFCILMPLMLTAQQAMMQLDNIPGDKEVSVTNWVPVVNSVVGDILAIQPYTNRVHAIEARTNAWNTAFGWGDHSVAGYLLQEQDRKALRAWHYGNSDIVESPEDWFIFDSNTGTITGYINYGYNNFVLPWEIGGVAVRALGDYALQDNSSITNVVFPRSVVYVGKGAMQFCSQLRSIIMPCVEEIGDISINNCHQLKYVYAPKLRIAGKTCFGQCQGLEEIELPSVEVLADFCFYLSTSMKKLIAPNLKSTGRSFWSSVASWETNCIVVSGSPFVVPEYGIGNDRTFIIVDNPHATGWGETHGGRPVVRLPVTADEVHIGGELAATQPYVDNAIANIPEPGIDQEAVEQIALATYATQYGGTNWLEYTETVADTQTVTADGLRPIRVTAMGYPATINLTGFTSPLPAYMTVQGATAIEMPGAYHVGGGCYQAGMINHYLVWQAAGQIMVQFITATEVP